MPLSPQRRQAFASPNLQAFSILFKDPLTNPDAVTSSELGRSASFTHPEASIHFRQLHVDSTQSF